MVGQRMLGDIGERFFEMGQSLKQQTKQGVKGFGGSFKKQVTGKTDGQKGQVKGGGVIDKVKPAESGEGEKQFAEMLGIKEMKKMSDEELAQVKEKEEIEKKQKTATIQRRIKEIEREIAVVRAKKEQEEEEKEQREEAKKKQIEQLKVEEEKKSELPRSVSQRFGSREKGRIVSG